MTKPLHIFLLILSSFLTLTAARSQGVMRITEFMYQGNGTGSIGEFVEFTNVGNAPVDMTGWSYDDSHHTPGAVPLTAFGLVQPGESVLLTDMAAIDFRVHWNLCNGIKIIGGNLNDNLGRADEIHLYDATQTQIDFLKYDDQSLGNPRTQGTSAWVSAAGLGNNIAPDWTLSTVGDAETSYTSTLGEIGSPGKSSLATVAFNPCPAPDPNAPTIALDVASTTNLLDGGLSASPLSPYAISGVINDPTDPASTLGLFFTVGDPNVDVSTLQVSATSSNLSILPAANLALTGSNASYKLLITPAIVGYSTITVTVSNGTLISTYQIQYAASQSSSASLRWLTGISDASAAIPLDDTYMLIGDDEQNQVFIYNRQKSGLPVVTYDYNKNNVLALTDGSGANFKEVDVEAAAPSPTTPGLIYLFGSMSNNSSAQVKADRDRIIALTTAAPFTNPNNVANAGYATNVRTALIAWGDAHLYDFTDAAKDGTDPKTPDGFNIEGAVFAPDNTTLWYGFRAPLVPQATHAHALIAPLLNFEFWFTHDPNNTTPTFGDPIELDLGGRGIRDMIRLTNGTYVIAAGSADETSNPAIYTWTGNPADAPVAQPSFDVTNLNVEGLLQVNTGGQIALDQLQLITDNGSTFLYNDGVEAKDLTSNNFKKFATGISISPFSPLPIGFESFTAQRSGANVNLNWKIGPGPAASFDVLRSADGTNFRSVHSEPGVAGQTAYTYADKGAPASKLWYRIQTTETSGQQDLSTIRVLSAAGAVINNINLYPNPAANGTFTLAISAAGLKTVSVYSSAGLLIQQSSFADNAKDFSTAGWAKGLYLLRIVLPDGSTTTEKLTIN